MEKVSEIYEASIFLYQFHNINLWKLCENAKNKIPYKFLSKSVSNGTA